jgi:hypothetical protein
MTSLQQTAMGGGSPSTKTASYVLTAADAGTVIQMNSASATTITVNTSLFAAGDSVQIQNIGAGVMTITAGTATVNSAGSLGVTQYDGGFLYFSSTSSAIWFDYTQAGTTLPLTTKGDLFGYDTGNARIPVGADATVLTADSTQALGVKWATPSSGAITWTQRLAGTGITIYSIAYNGTNLYVAAGSAGTLYTSPDAKTWTSRTSGFGSNLIYQVAFGNGLWVAVGANGTITTSPDGTTWTARTANMSTNAIYNVTYANSLWVAVGAGGGITNTGGITYSSDGTTWTRKSQSLTIGSEYYAVVWNGTNWIVGANNDTNNHLYASTPSGTWTAGATGDSNNIGVILWDGTRHIVALGTSVAYSTSTTLGTTTNYQNVASINGSEATKQYFQLYSNLLYRFTMAMQTFVPVSTAYPSLSAPVLLPSTAVNSAGTAFTQGVQTSFVGAAGIIVVGGGGRIYTSF